MQLNWLDWTLLPLLLLSSILGLRSGLAAATLRLGVVLLALFCALRYGKDIGGLVADKLPEEWMGDAAGYLGAFLLVLVAGGLAVEMLRRLLKASGMGGFDRFGGLLFGVLRAYVLIVAAFVAVGFTPLTESAAVRESQTAFAFMLGAEWVVERYGDNFGWANQLSEHAGDQAEQEERIRPSRKSGSGRDWKLRRTH